MAGEDGAPPPSRMLEDYYSPHPRMVLPEPVVVAGAPGSDAGAIVHSMASFTGLPILQVDRWIEARSEKAIAGLAVTAGAAVVAAQAAAALERSLTRRPPPLVALEGAAPALPQMEALREEVVLVHVRRSPAQLLRRIRARLEAVPGCLPQFPFGAPDDAGCLEPLVRDRDALFANAELVVEAGDRGAVEVARELIATLDRITRPKHL